jgi:hypothetical protein
MDQPPPSSLSSGPFHRVGLTGNLAPQINFVCHRNSVLAMRKIEWTNTSAREPHDFTLDMRPLPTLLVAENQHADGLLVSCCISLTIPPTG